MVLTTRSDAALVKRALKGREDAYTELFNRYYASVVRFCYPFTAGDMVKSDDLAQESFISAFNSLEKLRDISFLGNIDKLYILSADRLARKYVYQVLLVEEFQKYGVEIIFLQHEHAQTPEGDLLLQMQGMIAEYERAKIIERSRRGKLHKARKGSVNVLSGAPYGYRYITAKDNGGEAQYIININEV